MTTTASIYFNKINIDYPRAGKDNDSQGFRDNFRNIFNAFSATNADLENLQLNSVTLGGNNDFGYNTIKKASFQSCVTKIIDYSPNPQSGNIYINFNDGNYYLYSLDAGNSTFYIQNWPASGHAELRVVITPNSSSTTQISFGGNLTQVGDLTLPVVTNSSDMQTFDLWTDDGGLNIYIQGLEITPVDLVYNNTNIVQTSTVEVNYFDGKYQKFTLSTGTATVNISNLPISTNTVAMVNLTFKTTTTEYSSTLTFKSDSGPVQPVGSQTQPYTISTTATQFFEVWSDNGGSTVYVLQKGI